MPNNGQHQHLQLEATIVTTMDVEVDELCISTVARIPNIKPTTGFFRCSLLRKKSPVTKNKLTLINEIIHVELIASFVMAAVGIDITLHGRVKQEFMI